MQSSPPPVAPPPKPTATTTQRAGLWRRFGAFVHELLFLVAYLFIVGLVFAAFSGESMQAGRPQILTGPVAVLQQLYLLVTIGVYFVFFWTQGRRTLAFKTWQLRLADAATGALSPTRKQAIVRYVAAWIGPALALLVFTLVGGKSGPLWFIALISNFAWAIVDRDRQFLHDRIAGTRIVYVKE